MADTDVAVAIRAVADSFARAMPELQRRLNDFGRAARHVARVLYRGKAVPSPRQVRIERRAHRRRLARMLREQRRD